MNIGPLYPDLLPLIARIQDDAPRVTGYKLRITEGTRSYTLQDARYAIGRTVMGKLPTIARPLGQRVTNARAGMSWHQYGLAMDWCFVSDDPYLEKLIPSDAAHAWDKFGELVKAYGFQWGGDFKLLVDKPHTQLTYGLTIHEAMEMHAHGGMRGVWTYIDKLRGCDTSSLWPDLSEL